jgi:plasmid maintenance system antidote protein VapI
MEKIISELGEIKNKMDIYAIRQVDLARMMGINKSTLSHLMREEHYVSMGIALRALILRKKRRMNRVE